MRLGFAGLTPLQEAVLTGSPGDVAAQIAHSRAVPDQNMFLQSALHLAVWRPQHLQALLQGSLDIDQPDWAGRTPLMYAAATGTTEVAIALLAAGASLWREDDLFKHHDFLHYAVNATHWNLVIAALEVVKSAPRSFSTSEVQNLLDAAIIAWAKQGGERRKSKHLHTLLAMGADANVVFSWRSDQFTLLHRITTIEDVDILVAGGFRKFDHQNSEGAHPLMHLARLDDPQLVQKCIDNGSLTNHQDRAGRTALYAIAQDIRTLIGQPLTSSHYNHYGLKKLECAEVLLKHGADAFLGDQCQCACSVLGCTPGHLLLKECRRLWLTGNISALPRSQYYLCREWLDLIQEVNGLERAKQCLLDIIRLARFEQHGLTHTCCRRSSSEACNSWTNLEEEEVNEIRDEEKELVSEFESAMTEVERDINSGADLDTLFFAEVNKLIEVRNERQRSLFLGSRTRSNKVIHPEFHVLVIC